MDRQRLPPVHPRISPLSRYGDGRIGHLTLGIALDPCTESLGFHRFEPVLHEQDCSRSGQFNYPTRNFAQLPRTSPYGLDHIFASNVESRRLAYGL
jgi:hypothetical protein